MMKTLVAFFSVQGTTARVAKELAEHLTCSQQVYSNYELGQRDIPLELLIRLARFYGTSVDYLLGESDDPKRK